jgi:hypothetical protein
MNKLNYNTLNWQTLTIYCEFFGFILDSVRNYKKVSLKTMTNCMHFPSALLLLATLLVAEESCHHVQDKSVFGCRLSLMMEAARTFETLVNFYQTTRCYNPEDSNLHLYARRIEPRIQSKRRRMTLVSTQGHTCAQLCSLHEVRGENALWAGSVCPDDSISLPQESSRRLCW